MRFTPRRRIKLALALLTLLPLSAAPPARAQARKDVVVFAAASLKNALDEVTAAWQRDTGKKAVVSYAASSALAKQIEAGAPADLFISADLDWMDYLAENDLIDTTSRVSLLGNTIVLVAPRDSTVSLTIAPGFDLAGAIGQGRLAMANVDSVPAGKYGKAALQKLGAWDGVEGRVAQAENVRAALLLVSRGEAPLGIVYATDAASDPAVKIVGSFPESSHPPIIYPVALTRERISDDAPGLLDFVRSAGAKAIFVKHGFTILNKPVAS